MSRVGKRMREAAGKVDRSVLNSLEDGVRLVKECGLAKFDETVELAINLGVDPRHAEQMVRGVAVLPHGTGKTVRVMVFAKGEKVQEAQEAGADFVGAEEFVEKIQGGWLDFDRTVACPDVMNVVGRIGRVLGPRGLMPNPKVGTVTFDVGRVVREIKAGQVAFRVDKSGIVHAGVGKVSFAGNQLVENIRVLLDQIKKLRPSSIKGTYVNRITLSSTMGPGVRLDPKII